MQAVRCRHCRSANHNTFLHGIHPDAHGQALDTEELVRYGCLNPVMLTDGVAPKCDLCRQRKHVYLQSCPAFRDLRVVDKRAFLEESGRCANCWLQGHITRACPRKARCLGCYSYKHR